MEGAEKVLKRQKHALSESTTPFACTLCTPVLSRGQKWGLRIFGEGVRNRGREPFLARKSCRETPKKGVPGTKFRTPFMRLFLLVRLYSWFFRNFPLLHWNPTIPNLSFIVSRVILRYSLCLSDIRLKVCHRIYVTLHWFNSGPESSRTPLPWLWFAGSASEHNCVQIRKTPLRVHARDWCDLSFWLFFSSQVFKYFLASIWKCPLKTSCFFGRILPIWAPKRTNSTSRSNDFPFWRFSCVLQ